MIDVYHVYKFILGTYVIFDSKLDEYPSPLSMSMSFWHKVQFFGSQDV